MHQVQHTPSTVYMSTAYLQCSIHTVQAYTEYSIHSIWTLFPALWRLRVDCTMELQVPSYRPTDRWPASSSLWELKHKANSSHSHGCEITDLRIECQHQSHFPIKQPQINLLQIGSLQIDSLHIYCLNIYHFQIYCLQIYHLQIYLLLIYLLLLFDLLRIYHLQMCCFMIYCLQIKHLQICRLQINCLQEFLPYCSMMTSKFISKLAQSWHSSASLSSHNHAHQVQLCVRSIKSSMCLLKFTSSQPTTEWPTWLHHGLQVPL